MTNLFIQRKEIDKIFTYLIIENKIHILKCHILSKLYGVTNATSTAINHNRVLILLTTKILNQFIKEEK